MKKKSETDIIQNTEYRITIRQINKMETKTYAGISKEFAQLAHAKIVLIPVPYDGTSTWQKGADKGPTCLF